MNGVTLPTHDFMDALYIEVFQNNVKHVTKVSIVSKYSNTQVKAGALLFMLPQYDTVLK
jgi:hypothetical protein